jgi:hypothetical protein
MALALLACQSVAQDLVTLEGVNGAVEVIGEGDDQITVLYTWGTPYEMGYAHGKLLTEGVRHLYEVSLARFMFGIGMGAEQIDEVWAQAEPHMLAADLEEMRGLADGTDGAVSFDDVKRLHIVPEISEWHCTFFAAWGEATRDGNLIQTMPPRQRCKRCPSSPSHSPTAANRTSRLAGRASSARLRA